MKAVDFADDGGFSFTAELEVRPEYELPEIEGLTLPEVSLDVSEAEIDAELAKIQEEQAVWQPADEEAVTVTVLPGDAVSSLVPVRVLLLGGH